MCLSLGHADETCPLSPAEHRCAACGRIGHSATGDRLYVCPLSKMVSTGHTCCICGEKHRTASSACKAIPIPTGFVHLHPSTPSEVMSLTASILNGVAPDTWPTRVEWEGRETRPATRQVTAPAAPAQRRALPPVCQEGTTFTIHIGTTSTSVNTSLPTITTTPSRSRRRNLRRTRGARMNPPPV